MNVKAGHDTLRYEGPNAVKCLERALEVEMASQQTEWNGAAGRR